MTTDPRIAVLSALSSPDWHPVPEAHGMPWDEAEQLLDAYDASRAAAEPAAAPPTDRAAVLREAADAAEALRQFEPATGARKSAQTSENVGILRVATELRRLADEEQQQPDVRTPCSVPNGCDPDGDLCDQHETERAHAEGEHAFCGVTCEVEFPTEMLRNFILAKGYPGTAGALDELLRRAAAGLLPAEPGKEADLNRCPAKHGALGRICELPTGHSGMHTGSGPNGGAVWDGDAS